MSKLEPVSPNLITTRIIDNKPRHNVIYSAAASPDGKIYLGLSAEFDSPGVFCQIVRYDPEQDCFEDIVDYADIVKQPPDSLRHPHSKIHTAICIDGKDKVYAAHPYDHAACRRGLLSFLARLQRPVALVSGEPSDHV